MRYEDYIQLDYSPSKNDVIVEFLVEPSKNAGAVAAESSIGTWTEVKTFKRNLKKLAAKVFEIRGNRVKIAYPLELFEPGNMSQILSSIAGNIFGMKAVKNLRLEDVHFPKKLERSFPGPRFGISGVRRLLKVRGRPLLGSIIKPKLGLGPKEHAEVAYETWLGGCDIIKDDENLTDQRFNPFEERVVRTLEARDKAEEETGEKKAYMPNVTAPFEEMIRRIEFVKEHGGRYVMIDAITSGFSALQSVRDMNFGLVIHAHRAMHAAFTRNKKHGMSMLALAKCLRLVGVDQLHVGTGVGKMEGEKEEVKEIAEALREKKVVKPVFPVASGGLHPGLVPPLMKIFGKDVIIQAGGGIHGHPDGSFSGTRAMRQAIEAVMKGISLKKYAKAHQELREALNYFP